MQNSKPLTQCRLSLPTDHDQTPHAALIRALRFQAESLGIEVQTSKKIKNYSSQFQAHGQATIDYQITLPYDHHFSEFLHQTAFGIAAVHGRSSGKAQVLGLNYLSHVVASMTLQGILSIAIAQARGLSIKKGQLSSACASLTCVAQYIAGASAEPAEKFDAGEYCKVNRPPFTSADGIVFELETLSATPWKKFWLGLVASLKKESDHAIDLRTIGQSWNAFFKRYACAVAPMPETMMQLVTQFDYNDICHIAQRCGVAVIEVSNISQWANNPVTKSLWRSGPWSCHWQVRDPYTMSKPPPSVAKKAKTGDTLLPLSGIKVIESSRRIQGPMASHCLQLLGADIIRIEPPGGDPLRAMPPLAGNISARFDALNGKKTTLEIDIKTLEGRETIYGMAENAHVFLHNWAPGKAKQLALHQEKLHGINPNIITAYAGGFSQDVQAQHEKQLPGTDFMVQAYSGLADIIANHSKTNGGSLFTVLDILGGMISAQGILACQLMQLTEHVSHISIESGLLSSALLLAEEPLSVAYESDDKQKPEPKPLLRDIFSTQKGKLAIEILNREQAELLTHILGIETAPLEQNNNKAWREQLVSCFQKKCAEQWVTQLHHHAIPCTVVLDNFHHIASSHLAPFLEQAQYCQVRSPWQFDNKTG